MGTAKTYEELHSGQLQRDAEGARLAANFVIDTLSAVLNVKSVLDVGCGVGTWLRVFQERLACDVRGMEGEWLNTDLLEIESSLVTKCDVSKSFRLGRKFDLVLSIEVAEHLAESSAKSFVEALVSHSDAVVFSAAIPGQGGTGHLNEQFADYWIGLFREFEYVPLDLFRWQIWNEEKIPFWLKQNLLFFTTKKLSTNFISAGLLGSPLSVVHPHLYSARLQNFRQLRAKYEQLLQFLSANSRVYVSRNAAGGLELSAGDDSRLVEDD